MGPKCSARFNALVLLYLFTAALALRSRSLVIGSREKKKEEKKEEKEEEEEEEEKEENGGS